ncbi:Zn-dependent peptidase ImmA (M78 family) [Dyadobacter jejuensis]|uniref:Zn-dependent peptidase ImmA (M78 family) n=1 Tax=Dyadobacter jejuensis TaxID=1082580 RepID=A0A316AM65_9BACT|nr:ImmA/IrrE family metallo-endopeptidase [Dyadobacter jejuensis]PWJ58661.1 Zn-dependent peptidase ImmA (M78 family) [Dyadobacter jejuensis]
MKIEQNIERLKYLLTLFKMSVEELLPLINEGLAKPITKEQILSPNIELGHLKRIDKIFKKGIHYYLDPKVPDVSKDASIFFRKAKFDVNLSLGARIIVNHFEEFKISLSAIAALSDIKFDRILPVFTLNSNPKEVAAEVRKLISPEAKIKDKDFLTELIKKLAEKNIFVFEFVETWNKKEKANIDGFFLQPNVIVLKRQQTSFKREIFTLAHELGHFLLNEEEIDRIDYQDFANDKLSKIEYWCNEFAFYFLGGEFVKIIETIDHSTAHNDYNIDLIRSISESTHLSRIAIFTKLLLLNKISRANYDHVKAGFEEDFRIKNDELKKKRELDKQNGIISGGSTPLPIKSPLLVSTIQTAFYEGVINEYEFCKKLNIKPDKIDRFLYESSN